jgi:hypothetical protein
MICEMLFVLIKQIESIQGNQHGGSGGGGDRLAQIIAATPILTPCNIVHQY